MLTVFFSLVGAEARAQDAPKAEIGAQFSLIRFRDLSTTAAGFGGRVGFGVNDYVTIEAEVNFFPEDGTGFFESGRKTQGLFGVKTGIRSEGAGIFAKFRPGFVHFSRNFEGLEVGGTEFAFDVGGVVELYPAGRAIVRFDIGDTIIRFGEQNLSVGTQPAFTSHNLQFSLGVGIRF
jgi:hypothetical protein